MIIPVSIGISHNILLARVATRRAKPAGSHHILPEDVPNILTHLDIKDLRGFGRSTRNKVEAKFGVTTLGELTKRTKGALCEALGKKTGETLWNAIRGIDDTKIISDHVRKSVSCEINVSAILRGGPRRLDICARTAFSTEYGLRTTRKQKRLFAVWPWRSPNA